MSTISLEEKCTQLELDLRTSDENLLSMLEYGADPKEMDHPGGISPYAAAHRMSDDSSGLVSAFSKEPGQPYEYAAANADKERRVSVIASPARSDRHRLIPAWKPTDDARASSKGGALSGPSPRPRDRRLVSAWRATDEAHPSSRSRSFSGVSPRAGGSAQKPRAAWGAGPAAQPPPPGRRPSNQPLRQSAPLVTVPQQGGEGADRGALSLMAAQPQHFPCSLDPSPVSSSEASAGAGNAAIRQPDMARCVVPARTSSSSDGCSGQLVKGQAGAGRWGLTSAPAGALDMGAMQAQMRMKNRVIADLRSQKQQLTEELEAALMENQQLKQKVQQGEQLKGQHDGLLERLRGARQELDQALAQKQQSDLAMGSLQQRVRAMAAKQALSRETEHKMATRMMEKNQMLDQLYDTLKDLKQQYEASREEAAKAAAGLEEARCQVEHHQAAVEEVQKVHGDASAALVSLGLRCEGLADTLAAERSAGQATDAVLRSTRQEVRDTETGLQSAQQELQACDRQLSIAAADLHGARQRIQGLEQELQSSWNAAQAQRHRAAALQEDLNSAWADTQEQRRAAADLAQEADALRAKLAEVPDQESDEELEGSDLDIALPAFMGESRAQLMRSQETLRGQLAAELQGAATEDGNAPLVAKAEDDVHDDKPCPTIDVNASPCNSQDGMVQSAKEAFEAMSASGGWSVYTNTAAMRISDGGHSSGLTHEL